MKKQFEYNLEEALDVSVDGTEEKVFKLLLSAPFSSVQHLSAPLKQALMVVLMNTKPDPDAVKRVKETPMEDTDLTSDQVIQVLYGSKDIDIVDVLKKFKDLLLQPRICEVARDKRSLPIYLKQLHLDNLSADDVDHLMGEYLLNFFMISMLTGKK